MREGTRLWENMEDCGRAERITGKRKHFVKTQDCGRTWKIMGENRIVVERWHYGKALETVREQEDCGRAKGLWENMEDCWEEAF